MEHYICIHGHFYQPLRENAWLGRIERQDSAYPYHDWNERITAECYLPNATSRLLDGEGYINRITNNYSKLSYDFGPTLLAWMESNYQDVYQAIIIADRESRERYSGHGSALAGVYNHMIMPLANHHDRYTQAVWGIKDFIYRFGRQPEGMWLPETAVDFETLDIMAELGIKFTILAPHQAKSIRRTGARDWKDVSGGRIDTGQAYLVNLPSGRRFCIFFYDGAIAGEVSFSDILKNSDTFVKRLIGAFNDKGNRPTLLSIATDGENYGHHHRFGDMTLAYAFDYIEKNKLAGLTNYGEFLEKYPPVYEVEIIEKTSWSCVHGVDRWWSDCGDKAGAGGHPDWNQKWRTPLRNAFDMLRDNLAPEYEEKDRRFFKDPWATRDGYIDVLLDRSPENISRFFGKYATHELDENERTTALQLLDMQRCAMLMYTSDGWYFDELSRPEPVQVMQYAGRVAQLAEELFGKGIESRYLNILEQAKSNIPSLGNGRQIFEYIVRPAMLRAKAGTSYDEQLKNLNSIIDSAVSNIENSFRPLFEKLCPPERYSAELSGPLPRGFQIIQELIINNALHQVIKKIPVDTTKVADLLDATAKWRITLDTEGIAYNFKITLEKMMAGFAANPTDIGRLKDVLAAVSLARRLPFPVDLWKVQNIFWDIMNNTYPRLKEQKEWADVFIALGEQLLIHVKWNLAAS